MLKQWLSPPRLLPLSPPGISPCSDYKTLSIHRLLFLCIKHLRCPTGVAPVRETDISVHSYLSFTYSCKRIPLLRLYASSYHLKGHIFTSFQSKTEFPGLPISVSQTGVSFAETCIWLTAPCSKRLKLLDGKGWRAVSPRDKQMGTIFQWEVIYTSDGSSRHPIVIVTPPILCLPQIRNCK